MAKKKLTEEKKLKAYKAFEESQVRQIPLKERQESAIFQVRVKSMMDKENSRKGGKSFVASALKTYEFTPEEIYRFIDGLDAFKTGVVEELQDFEATVKQKEQEADKVVLSEDQLQEMINEQLNRTEVR